MHRKATPTRAFVVLRLLVLCAGVGGCAGEGATTGREILAGLERDGVPVPDEARGAQAGPAARALPASGPITLADLLSVAEAGNPDLGAARSEVGVSAGRLWQASLYPNPSADLLIEDISLSDGASGSKTTVGFTQPIVIGGRLRSAMDGAEADRAARLAGVEARRWELFGRIAEEHARLIALGEQRRLYAGLREIAERTLAAAQTRFEARAAPETDVIRPRVELHLIDASIARVAQEEARAARLLGLLLGGVGVDGARVVGELPMEPARLDLDRLGEGVRSGHPALLAAVYEIDGAGAELARVRAERVPDLDVRVGAGYRGEEDDGVVEIGTGVSLPLWDGGQGDALSARFGIVRARQRRAALENELLGRLTEAAGEYEGAKAQLDTFRDLIVPDAERAFEQTSEGYRAGRASFLDLLDAQRTLADARVTLTELAGAVAVARARVAGVAGPGGLAPGLRDHGADEDILPRTIQERPTGAEGLP